MVNETSDVIATLEPSPFRFWFGITCLLGLTIVLLYIGVSNLEVPLLTRLLFLGFGSAAGILALRIANAGRVGLVLTGEALTDTDGRVVALMDQIKSADRGFVMFKPSNGFVLFLDTKLGFAWRPGLWWRVGRRVGAGGITSGPAAKFMADAISAMIAERDGTSRL